MRDTWRSLGEVVTRVVADLNVEQGVTTDRATSGKSEPTRPTREAIDTALAAFAPVGRSRTDGADRGRG